MCALCALFALLPAVAGAQATTLASVPAEFLGRWAADSQACGNLADPKALTIEAHQVSQWRMSGRILAITGRSGNDISLILDLREEARSDIATMNLQLSADRRMLTTAREGAAEAQLLRCTAQPQDLT